MKPHEQGWTATKAYCQTKLANVLYCKDLAKRLEADGISAYCMHPGKVPFSFFDLNQVKFEFNPSFLELARLIYVHSVVTDSGN